MYRELRVYRVKPGAMDAWVAEWHEHVYPLRRELGFAVRSAWTVPDKNLFVWVLEYDGADFEAANQAYYDSPQRQALDPDPARHLIGTEHWPLEQVYESPGH